MTDIREVEGAGQGLFATKTFSAGEVVLSEDPLLVCNPNTTPEMKAIREQFLNIEADPPKHMSSSTSNSCISDLKIPPSVDVDVKYIHEFRGMLQAAASYALLTCKETKSKLQNLYAPSLTDPNEIERSVVKLAQDAFSFLGESQVLKSDSPLSKLISESPDDCKTIMLVWSCNSFKGGLIYDTTSRINHSCDYNAVIATDAFASSSSSSDDKKQIIRATAEIKAGDEISISYLGSITYADCTLRNERLLRDKFFRCTCTRCQSDRSTGDIAAAIPCTSCHPRDGRYLDEDVQYDDGEVEVNYCLPRMCKRAMDGDTNDKFEYEYHCEKCGKVGIQESLVKDMNKTIERAMSHLDQGLSKSSEIDDDEGERDAMLEMTERLAGLSTSVLGSKHYLTNLLSCVMLGRKLSALNAAILCKTAMGNGSSGSGNRKGKNKKKSSGTDNADDEVIDTTEVAECIHSLEQLSTYIESLNLKSHPGHLTGSLNVGVARVLIGLGDVKSMKYGASFASKVYDNYFKLEFEGGGMVKVVETLLGAWKKKAEEEGDTAEDGGERKRIKL